MRLRKAEQVADLHAHGFNLSEIGRMLGLSRSYTSALWNDPDGRVARERKDNYSLPCPRCGTLMSGSNGLSGAPRLCVACSILEQTEERYWTAERVIARFCEFKAQTGRQPTAVDIQIGGGGSESVRVRLSDERIAEAEDNHGIKLPRLTTIYREFGSLDNALRAAGMQPNQTGGPAHRNPKGRSMPEFLVLRKNGNDWTPVSTLEAPNSDAAIERGASIEGTYVAIRSHAWTERTVQTAVVLAIVRE